MLIFNRNGKRQQTILCAIKAGYNSHQPPIKTSRHPEPKIAQKENKTDESKINIYRANVNKPHHTCPR
jgi:hypothetical protein